MSCEVPRDVFLDAAFLRYDLDTVLAVIVTRNGQQLVSFVHTVVFLDDMLGDIQQSDIRFDTRFLTVGIQPQMPSNEVCRFASVRFAISVQLNPVKMQKMNKSRISS